MRALVKYAAGKGNVGVRDVPVREPDADEILIKVKYCGICGTDLHIEADEFPNAPPVVMGHEYCGIIAEVGEGGARPLVGWRQGGGRTAHRRLRCVCPVPGGQAPHLRPEAGPGEQVQRRLCRVSDPAGMAGASAARRHPLGGGGRHRAVRHHGALPRGARPPDGRAERAHLGGGDHGADGHRVVEPPRGGPHHRLGHEHGCREAFSPGSRHGRQPHRQRAARVAARRRDGAHRRRGGSTPGSSAQGRGRPSPRGSTW